MAESCAECSAETRLFLAEIVPRFSTSKLNSGDVPEDNQTDYVTISNYCGEAGVALCRRTVQMISLHLGWEGNAYLKLVLVWSCRFKKLRVVRIHQVS